MFSESNGCNTAFKLENLQNHVNQCIFNPSLEVTCDKGCGLKIIKKEYDNNCISHLANLVIHQQKQISRLNAKVTILMKRQQIWQKCDGIKVSEQNILEYQVMIEDIIHAINYTGIRISYTGIAQSIEPLKPEYSYFEIKILQLGNENSISIGLTCKECQTNRHPGCEKGSIGYHGDDGKIFIESGAGVKFGPLWQTSDIIGCGVKFPPNFTGNGNSVVMVYFTRNNELIGEKPIGVPNGGFFPTIGMRSMGAKVTVDLFQNNF